MNISNLSESTFRKMRIPQDRKMLTGKARKSFTSLLIKLNNWLSNLFGDWLIFGVGSFLN